MLNIEGAHTGVRIYVNGTLMTGISKVAADAQATHVVGFVPVVVDLTPLLHIDGTTDNVIAVDVSKGSPWFETPNFSEAYRFGQSMTGLFRNVYLYVTNRVHIPLNVYFNQGTWAPMWERSPKRRQPPAQRLPRRPSLRCRPTC